MDLSFYEFVGDGLGNDDVVSSVKSYLEEKYNLKFIALRIGNRYGGDTDDVATVYLCPEVRRNFIFSVKYNIENCECKDDFLYRKVCYELEYEISNILREENINSLVRVDIIKKNTLDEDLTLKDFIMKYGTTNFLAYIILDGKVESIKNVYKKILEKYQGIKINSYIYEASREEFETLKEKVGDLEYFSKSILGRYIKNNPSIFRIIDNEIIEVK